jgi:hypothetical protein
LRYFGTCKELEEKDLQRRERFEGLHIESSDSMQKKMSRGKGLQGYSAGRIPYPFTSFTSKLSNTNRNQFQRIGSHGPECKCSICLVMLFHIVLESSRLKSYPAEKNFSKLAVFGHADHGVVGECFGGLEIEMNNSL